MEPIYRFWMKTRPRRWPSANRRVGNENRLQPSQSVGEDILLRRQSLAEICVCAEYPAANGRSIVEHPLELLLQKVEVEILYMLAKIPQAHFIHQGLVL